MGCETKYDFFFHFENIHKVLATPPKVEVMTSKVVISHDPKWGHDLHVLWFDNLDLIYSNMPDEQVLIDQSART